MDKYTGKSGNIVSPEKWNHEVDCQEGDRKVKILLDFYSIVGVDCQLVLNKINQTKEDRKWGNKYVYRKIPAVPQV